MLLPNRLQIKSRKSMQLTLTLASGMDPGFLVPRVDWAAIWGLRKWDKFFANSSFWKQCPKSSHSHGGLFFQVDDHLFPAFSLCHISGFENTHRLTQHLSTMTKVHCAFIYSVYSAGILRILKKKWIECVIDPFMVIQWFIYFFMVLIIWIIYNCIKRWN